MFVHNRKISDKSMFNAAHNINIFLFVSMAVKLKVFDNMMLPLIKRIGTPNQFFHSNQEN